MADVNGDSVPQTNGHGSSSPPSQPNAPPNPQPTPSTSAPAANTAVPLTSLQDNGLSKRPRDARLIHMLLSSLGVAAYQERVPQTRARDAPPGGGFRDADGQVSANAVQLAIQSRLQYQFGGGNGGGLSKEFLLETAQARNKIGLPRVLQNEWGVRLPAERFVLTGVPWGLKDEWEEEEDISMGDAMEGVMPTQEETADGDEEGAGDMNDLFGTSGDMDEDMDKEE
ncbi:hypothetical protein CJF30_00005528 [Rutstroemia sp. NJR-2017a BBW]|nr:hypothetical protein CJF30_00005856 [Rutstroemia sp. NJR-2017a BBW]PQE08660.1 hypothetical protein CJF30_00005528 [Rutstroemia sp. NJR-2017a BBW]